MTETLDVRRHAGEPLAALLAAAWAGVVWRLAPQTVAAAAALGRAHVAAALGPDPRRAQHRLDVAAFFARYTAARQALLADARNLPTGAAVAVALGFPPDATRLDRLRLRAVPSGGHRVAAAAPAYGAHRDTWYANPAAQVNLWVALDEVTDDEAFDFFPAHWEVAVANDSAAFDLAEWHAAGGWQAPTPGRRFPHALEPPRGPAVRVPCAAGEALLFSATHLHGTHAHDSGRTRFSLELRLVHEPDVPRLQAARRVDDASRGSTLDEMPRVADVLR